MTDAIAEALATSIQNAARQSDFLLPEHVTASIVENLMASTWLKERTESAPKTVPEETFLHVLNLLYKHTDLLEDIVTRIDDWHSIDRESLVEMIGESDRLTADDMPEGTWLQEEVAAYQAAIAARYAVREGGRKS